jgi:hypothetical protein
VVLPVQAIVITGSWHVGNKHMKLNSYTAYACDTIIFMLQQLRGTEFKEKQGAVVTA